MATRKTTKPAARRPAAKRARKAAKPSMAQRLQIVERRVQELEDDREIRELLSRYGFLADSGRFPEFVALFTDDGVMNLVSPRVANGVARWEGSEALLEFISGSKRRPDVADPMDLVREGRRMHVLGANLRTYIDGDEATAEGYSLVLTKAADGRMDVDAGSNKWLLRRVDGRWHIKERVRRVMGLASFFDAFVTQS